MPPAPVITPQTPEPAPQMPQIPQQGTVDFTYTPATAGRRFLTALLDGIISTIIVSILSIGIRMFSANPRAHLLTLFLINIILTLLYYIVFEAAWQRTPGKFITGTKVVNYTGGAPSLGQIVGRTFSRIIPFEVYSFLSKYPMGWHDRFPKTLVVPVDYSPEEVQKIDREGIRRVAGVNVFLVVLLLLCSFAIAGMMFTVGLSALNKARQKALEGQQGTTTPQSTTADVWAPYDSTIGNFKIDFPANPQHGTNQEATSQGVKINYDIFQATAQNGAKYIVTIAEFPAGTTFKDPQAGLESAMNTSARNIGGEVKSSEYTTFQTYPAMKFEIGTKTAYIKGIDILRDSNLYTVFVISPPDGGVIDYDRFIQSLILK